MLVKEDPGILELSPAFIMQRLVDLKVHGRPAALPAGSEHVASVAAHPKVIPIRCARLQVFDGNHS